jgi:hypothetical protein
VPPPSVSPGLTQFGRIDLAELVELLQHALEADGTVGVTVDHKPVRLHPLLLPAGSNPDLAALAAFYYEGLSHGRMT